MSIITRKSRKSHVVFGITHEGLKLTYCGLRWDGRACAPSHKRNHCKNCTREMKKAGMSWRWFEYQFKEAAAQ